MERSVEIPNKEHFKANEVCGLLGVKPYVLRFWEAEFPEISPVETLEGKKIYTQDDIEAVSLIKKLLFEDKLNIEKAKMELKIILNAREEEKREKETLGTEGDEDLESQGEFPFEPEIVVEQEVNPIDLEKLAQAKEKLGQLLAMTNSLKEGNNWH